MTTATLPLHERLLIANRQLEMLIARNNDDAESAADFQVTCTSCGRVLTPTEADAYDDTCQSCYDLTHFTCRLCGDVFELDERHDGHPSLCVFCGVDRDAELVEESKEQLRELVDDMDDLAKVRRAIKFLKRLTK